MKRFKPVSTLLAAHFKLHPIALPNIDEERDYIIKVSYFSTIGSLMYVMIYTRPNLAYTMSVVSKYMRNPEKAHLETANWIMQYLRGTVNTCLVMLIIVLLVALLTMVENF
jgi:flagellar biosynthesis protein FlhB